MPGAGASVVLPELPVQAGLERNEISLIGRDLIFARGHFLAGFRGLSMMWDSVKSFKARYFSFGSGC